MALRSAAGGHRLAEPDPQSQLTLRILIGMALGLLLGLVLNALGARGWIEEFLVGGLLYVGGEIFLASLKLLVVPLVFVSLVCGTASLDDLAKLGRIGSKTLGLYLSTTAIAISLALTAAVLVQPGAGFELVADVRFEPTDPPTLSQTFINLVPRTRSRPWPRATCSRSSSSPGSSGWP